MLLRRKVGIFVTTLHVTNTKGIPIFPLEVKKKGYFFYLFRAESQFDWILAEKNAPMPTVNRQVEAFIFQ